MTLRAATLLSRGSEWLFSEGFRSIFLSTDPSTRPGRNRVRHPTRKTTREDIDCTLYRRFFRSPTASVPTIDGIIRGVNEQVNVAHMARRSAAQSFGPRRRRALQIETTTTSSSDFRAR
jgi:hypothetical protein